MATLSTINIALSMSTGVLANDVAKADQTLKRFEGRVNTGFRSAGSSVGTVATRVGATVATFLTVEKILGKIRHAFAELEKKGSPIKSMLTQTELAGALAFRDTLMGANLELEAAILRVADRLAPAFSVAATNANSLLAPLLGVKDAMDAIEESVNFMSAQWANLQQIVSGIALQWYAVSTAMLPTEQASLIFQGKFAELEQSVKSTMELFNEGQKMFGKGFSGEAGKEVLKQIDAQRKKIDATHFINVDLGKLKAAATEIKRSLPDLHPGALQKGSAASVSAILKIEREKKGKETEKLLKEQLKVLKNIEKKGNRVEIVAIL